MEKEIKFDYGNLQISEDLINYIRAMLEAVQKKAAKLGLLRSLPAPLFEFRMSQQMWDGICDLFLRNFSSTIWPVEVKNEKAIHVGGGKFPVILDEAMSNSIGFMPQNAEDRFETSVVLLNIGR